MESEPCYTPFPWRVERGGGHANSRIVGSYTVQTNGWPEPRGGIRNASYSDTVCEFSSDLNLPGPAATAELIVAVPDILGALRELHDFAERSRHYRDVERSSKAFDRAAELLNRFGV